MPVATAESQLFELDRVEEAFKAILEDQVGLSVQSVKKRDIEKATTPRLEIVLTLLQNQGRRFLRQSGSLNALAMPLDTWDFTLQVTVVTHHGDPEQDHQKIAGLVRWSLQYYRLIQTWTTAVAPYHSITDIREAQVDNEVINEEGCDYERLTFAGMCNIRDSAWP